MRTNYHKNLSHAVKTPETTLLSFLLIWIVGTTSKKWLKYESSLALKKNYFKLLITLILKILPPDCITRSKTIIKVFLQASKLYL